MRRLIFALVVCVGGACGGGNGGDGGVEASGPAEAERTSEDADATAGSARASQSNGANGTDPSGSAGGGSVRIHVLRLSAAGGGGDAILVADSTLARARYALIDAGDASVADRIRELGIDTLDLMVLTHAHHDHYGGMPDVLDAAHVRVFAFNGQIRSAVTYRRMLERVRDAVPTVLVADTVRTVRMGARAGGTRVVILPPLPVYLTTDTDDGEWLNEGSLGVRIERGRFAFLTTGDAELEANERFAAAFPEWIDVDVLKLGHHGSSDATQPFWLEATSPDAAVVSANGTTHPHWNVLDLVRERGIALYCTADHGTITIVVTAAGGYTVRTEADRRRACEPGRDG